VSARKSFGPSALALSSLGSALGMCLKRIGLRDTYWSAAELRSRWSAVS